MTDNYQEYPQVRVTRAARKHLEKLLPYYRSQRVGFVSMTTLASEIILSTPLPGKGSKVNEQAGTNGEQQ